MNGQMVDAPDPVDAAIATAGVSGKKGQRVEMTQAQMRLASGRPAVLMFPVDLTALETLSLISGILQIADQIASSKPSPIVRVGALPRSVLPRSLRRGR